MDEKKQNKTGIMILLAMVAAMGFLAATEGWLRVSECGEVLPGELPPSAVEETGDWDTGSVNEYPGIIRFHVIANSDKQEDQQIKYMVRDEVFRKLENALTRKLLQEEARVSAEASEPAAKKESAAQDAEAVFLQGKRVRRQDSEAGSARPGSAAQAEISRAYIREHLPEIETWARECLRASGCAYTASARYGVCAIPAKNYDDLYFPAGNYEALTITIGEGAGQNWWCVIFPPLCMVDAADSAYRDSFHIDAQGRLVLKSKIRELLDRAS